MSRTSSLVGVTGILCASLSIASCAKPQQPAPKTAAAVQSAPVAPPAAPPLTLMPAGVARAALVATMIAPTLDHALESGLALARKATPLPLDAAAVRELAFSQLGVPSELSAQLDLGAPVSGAVVGFGHDEPIRAAFSFPVKAGTDVARFLSSVGTLVERRGPVWIIDTRSSGRGWFLPAGNAIVFADSEAGLVQAGSLALEARRMTSKDDVDIVIYPEGLARAANTDVKTALDQLLAQVEANAAATGTKLGPEALQQLRDLAAYATDLATAEIALDLNPQQGVTLLSRLHAKPGSKLEAVSRIVATAPIDPLLMGKEDAGIVVTSAYGDRSLEQLRRQRSRLPAATDKGASKGALAAGNLLDALAGGLTGTLSMVGRLAPELSLEMVYPIKDAASSAKIQSVLQATDRAAVTALLSAQATGSGVEAKVTRVQKESAGKLRAVHWTVSFTMPGDKLGVMKKLMGKNGLDVFASVIASPGGDKLAFTAGPGAKARLVAMGAVKAPAAETKPDAKTKPAAASGAKAAKGANGANAAMTGGLAEAAALAGARSLYYYVDLREGLAVAKALGTGPSDPRLQMVMGLLKAPVPILGGATGDASGRQLTLDMTVPPSCIAGIGGLFGAMMGAGAAAGGH
jgi:hypothetical protein